MIEPVYIFDVDGVINDIASYEPDKRVIEQIADLLKDGKYVAINTGRGYAWVKENIVDEMRKLIPTSGLDRVFVSAEMGGMTVTFTNGNEQDERTAFSLQPEQIDQVRQIYDEHAQSKNIGWYQGKVSMATIDKPAGVDTTAFLAEANEIADILRDLFAGKHIKINVNPDALDVTTPEAGKWAGAQLIHDWLQSTPAASAAHFVCFGDNSSDYEMARFFGQQGHKVEFVFTGKELGEIEHDPQVTLVKTEALYNEGTYSFLEGLRGPSA
jgi:HAD superfamily hydrolase (TIGR01484 family)